MEVAIKIGLHCCGCAAVYDVLQGSDHDGVFLLAGETRRRLVVLSGGEYFNFSLLFNPLGESLHAELKTLLSFCDFLEIRLWESVAVYIYVVRVSTVHTYLTRGVDLSYGDIGDRNTLFYSHVGISECFLV